MSRPCARRPQAQGGRFLSGIGYLNQQHPHGWDFVDAPLVYKVSGVVRLADGLQRLKRVAPTALFSVGGELARGGGLGSERDRNGAGLGALVLPTSGRCGESHVWQAGSPTRTHARERSWDDIDSSGLARRLTASPAAKRYLRGRTSIWKWSPHGTHAPELQVPGGILSAPGGRESLPTTTAQAAIGWARPALPAVARRAGTPRGMAVHAPGAWATVTMR